MRKLESFSTCDRVHDINGGDTCLYHGLGVITERGVDRLAVNVQVGLWENLGSGVNDFTRSVEGAPKNLLGNSHFEHIACELALCLTVINSRGSFEDL